MRAALYRRNGWARGLIHFHTRFSDGWATVRRAAELAAGRGFDFLIVTDHLRNLKLFTRRRVEDYIAECDRATAAVGIPVIPGGEIEINWDRPGVDRSEGHTIVFSIRLMARDPEVFDWGTPGRDPFWHWADDQGRQGTIAAVQQMLRRFRLPRAASHQFQHSPLSLKRGEHSDYRYDLERIAEADFLDFFYSGSMDVAHEPEDVTLLLRHHRPGDRAAKAVYASCDYHAGPEVTLPFLDAPFQAMPALQGTYRWLFAAATSLYLRWRAGDPELTVFPWFAAEQLTHATYVHVGPLVCTEESVLAGLRAGKTCVTRGTAEFSFVTPVPGLLTAHPGPARLMLELTRTWRPKYQRPHHVIVLRDGRPVHFEPYDIRSPTINFSWVDGEELPGVHIYQLYVPSKFLSSPILAG